MQLAICSGKGGTGKTTVATNLAYVASRLGREAAYLDCDVEEPNGAIFLKPAMQDDQPVYVSVPEVDRDKCTGCGTCGQICQYSAIVAIDHTVLTFPELCHGCGGCQLVCPAGAIAEGRREIGRLESGCARGVRFVQGTLHIGQAMSPPLIRAVKAAGPKAELTVIDCPPGTSCPVIEAMWEADYALLVTEPTPFGLNDLELAVETVRKLGIPFGVLINRADSGDPETRRFCEREGIPVLAEIPDVRAVAEAYSRGILPAEVSAHYREGFERLLETLETEGNR
ncbi:MAG: ATP-binding protein [Planctomycetota bacterium]